MTFVAGLCLANKLTKNTLQLRKTNNSSPLLKFLLSRNDNLTLTTVHESKDDMIIL